MAGALSRSLSTRERERGATIARQLLLLDPHHEKACRTLMQILADRGQSTAALGVYEALRRRLSHDLGVKPEPATLAAYEAIRRSRDGADGPADGSAMDAAATVESSEEHTSELQSLMRISYAVFCLKQKKSNNITNIQKIQTETKRKNL